jgi:hypothetical protein
MIEPLSLKIGKAFCTIKSTPLTLTLKVSSKCFSVINGKVSMHLLELQ